MAPSGKGKVDPKVSAQGTGESSGTTNNGLDLASDSEEDVGAGAGIERVTCSVEGCTWFQPITTLVPASEANKSMELHILGAHGLSIGGGNSQFATLVSDTLAIVMSSTSS